MMSQAFERRSARIADALISQALMDRKLREARRLRATSMRTVFGALPRGLRLLAGLSRPLAKFGRQPFSGGQCSA